MTAEKGGGVLDRDGVGTMVKANQPPNPAESSDRLFRDLLREVRRAAGLTQADLAERANVSVHGLSLDEALSEALTPVQYPL
jgi:hypothetical protein